MFDFDQILDSASLPETAVALCLNGRLRRQYEDVKARIDDRRAAADVRRVDGIEDTRMSDRPYEVDPDPEQPELDRLEAEMRKYTVEFVLRALPSQEWSRLCEKHPPRRLKEDKTKVDPRDYGGVNQAMFYPELVRKSIVSPELSDEQWDKLDGALTNAQFDRLANAAATVNRRDEDVPFSLRGSESPRNSDAA